MVDHIYMVLAKASERGYALAPGERCFLVIKTLIAKGALEDPATRDGAAALVKPWCGSLFALRFLYKVPSEFQELRMLCNQRNAAIYDIIDHAVTTPVLAQLAQIGSDVPPCNLRQDDPGLLPPFRYYMNFASRGEVGGDLEEFAAMTLALLGLSINEVFRFDMDGIFSGLSQDVRTAPSKTYQRMLNKLRNPREHGHPSLAKPRPAKNTDVNRCIVIVKTPADMAQAYTRLSSRYKVLRVKNTHSPQLASHGGYRSLLVNFAYRAGVTFRQVFGQGYHHDDEGTFCANHIARDGLGEKWLKFVKSIPEEGVKFPWGLEALWYISQESPDQEIVICAEAQILYQPYIMGRRSSHLLFKIARSETGPAEMVRDFHQEFYKEHWGAGAADVLHRASQIRGLDPAP
eukprot:TRINITY_DN59155_c0_g1_i1.p1 TRINITY_DN59155_c0_g1~~TRINITY_DN59155_c0_g1_i1.p1  ORF type:complete len:459 (+),score=56.14 TRINITY_DN59155_c0_g1_i1:171-1379(+)